MCAIGNDVRMNIKSKVCSVILWKKPLQPALRSVLARQAPSIALQWAPPRRLRTDLGEEYVPCLLALIP